MKKVEIFCQYCNKIFLGSKNRKYCSYNCSHSSRKKRETHFCFVCGKSFERQNWNVSAKYCSYECKNKSQCCDIIDVTCSNCGKLFKRKNLKKYNGLNQFCSRACLYQYNRGSNHYEWKGSLHDKHIKLALKQWGQQIKNRDDYVCKKCGESDINLLEAHHIIPRQLRPDLIFDLNNGITLCLNCHYEKHINDVKSSRLIKYKINKLNDKEKTKKFERVAF